jgi:hypothetical protein
MAGLNGVKYELTQEQLQALKDEINGDSRYAGITRGGICKLLNEKPLIDNPVQQGEVNASTYTTREIINGGSLSVENLKNIKAHADGRIVYDFIMKSDTIDLNNPTDVAFLTILDIKGLITNDQRDALWAMQKIPDPAWQAQIQGQSRAEELLVAGIVIEGRDVEAARAL